MDAYCRCGTKRTFQALTAADFLVVVIRDNPLSTFDIPRCLARSVRHSLYPRGSCEMEKSRVLNPAVFEAEKTDPQGPERSLYRFEPIGFASGTFAGLFQEGAVMYSGR